MRQVTSLFFRDYEIFAFQLMIFFACELLPLPLTQRVSKIFAAGNKNVIPMSCWRLTHAVRLAPIKGSIHTFDERKIQQGESQCCEILLEAIRG
jgi:hypothetical protein